MVRVKAGKDQVSPGKSAASSKPGEAALRESEQRYRSLFEQAGDAAVVLDARTAAILAVNKEACRRMGYSREEFSRLTIADVEVVESRKEVLAHARRVKRRGFDHFRTRMRTKAGEVRDFDVKAKRIRVGGRTLIQSVWRDVTRERQATEALSQTAALLRKSQRVGHIGSWKWYVRTDQLEWSDEMHAIFGLPKEGFTGDLREVISRAIHPEDRRKVERANRAVIKDKRPAPLEYRIVRPDGTIRVVWAEAEELTVDASGKPTVLAGIVMDITERKRAEDALEKARDELEQKVKERTARLRALTLQLDQAEEAERRKIAKILHDDLQQILAAARYALTGLHTDLPKQSRARTMRRVNQILDKAHDVMRSLCLDLSPPALYELGIGATLKWLQADMKRKFGLTVKVTRDGIADAALADLRFFVFQSVRELLFNVVKHSGVKSARVRLTPVNAQWVRLEVEDAGRGFDPARVVPNRLGLFGIRERVDYLGGRMEVQSAPGKGTCVQLTLPRM